MLFGKVRPNQGTKLELLKRQMWADRKESKEFPKAGGAEGWWDLEWLCLPHSHTCENWREVSAGHLLVTMDWTLEQRRGLQVAKPAMAVRPS